MCIFIVGVLKMECYSDSWENKCLKLSSVGPYGRNSSSIYKEIHLMHSAVEALNVEVFQNSEGHWHDVCSIKEKWKCVYPTKGVRCIRISQLFITTVRSIRNKWLWVMKKEPFNAYTSCAPSFYNSKPIALSGRFLQL